MQAVFTRDEYLSTQGREAQAAAHRRFYAQAVTPALRDSVASWIGADALRASTDPHLNDVPLVRWDRLQGLVAPYVHAMHRRIGYAFGVSLSDCVCVAKEAAKQWKEAQEAATA